MSTLTNPILRWSRNVLLIIGLLALSYVGYALLDARLYQAEQARRFERELKETNLPRAKSSGIAVSEGSPLGRIEISAVGLTTMILEGTEEGTLQRAVGHIRGTPLPGQRGNVAIAGHRDTYFRGLRDIGVNDEITLTTLSGSYHYRVDSTKVVKPEETEVLKDDGADTLTLVTCYPFNFVGSAPKRFIVRARRIPR
ncbi:MAG TPA: class D sortase [Blastocatellia bacterium]|nr:class D sortase [Blastocatellia bacterium]